MKIAINCRSFLNRKYTGIGRYAYHLLKSLSKIDEKNKYLLYVKKGFISINKRMPNFDSKNFCPKVDCFDKGMDKTLGKVDIFHSPSPDSLNINGGAKIIVTVHDLIFKTFPQGHTQKTLDDTEKQFEYICQRASKIICCSKNTVSDLESYFNIKKEKVSLVYQGVDKSVFYPIGEDESRLADHVIRSKGIRDPFLLSVGTIEPRKNLENVLQAFDKLRTRRQFLGKLVVVGMKGWMSDSIEGLIRKLELRDHVIFLGYLTDPELRFLYNKAEALVFPSFYEGFGFPIVEAFCCGTPVVTSNVSSCPEVAQDAAITVNPYSPEAIERAIDKIVNDIDLKKSLIEKGFKRVEDFSFHKTAQETLKIYEQVHKS
ncbi:MAG: glycosyltransferase family 1 protein [Candidatus Zapsychrus exili]|nr:glycosyltransferase family 1 protein [Candidatus Zapsychrus exili]